MNHDGFGLGRSISAQNLCRQSSTCMGGKRLPLLTNSSVAAADITSRFAACAPCHWSASTVPHVTGVSCSVASDSVLRRTRTSAGGTYNAMHVKEQPTSQKWNQQRSAVVSTLPLDLSVCCKSGRHDCRPGRDPPRTASDTAMLC